MNQRVALDKFPVRFGFVGHRQKSGVSAKEDARLSRKTIGAKGEHMAWRDAEIGHSPVEFLGLWAVSASVWQRAQHHGS